MLPFHLEDDVLWPKIGQLLDAVFSRRSRPDLFRRVGIRCSWLRCAVVPEQEETSGRIPEFAVWPRSNVVARHAMYQVFSDQRNDREEADDLQYFPFDGHHFSAGERITLSELWHARHDPTRVSMILFAALAREESDRHGFDISGHLSRVVTERVWQREEWHHSSHRVFPIPIDCRHRERIKRPLGYEYVDLVTAMAHDIADALEKSVLVEMWPTQELDPSIAEETGRLRAAAVERRRREAAEETERRITRERELLEERAAFSKQRSVHPRYGDWGFLRKPEFEKLVGSMPGTEIADLFGVSETAVRKRCKSWKIPKPRKGYWLQADKRKEGAARPDNPAT